MIISKQELKMTLEEKCAQVLFPTFRFAQPNFDEITLLAKKGIGGICIFGGSIFDVPAAINSFQHLARFPLIICSDLENGAGQQISGATEFPSNMAVGATQSEEFAFTKGKITAKEARMLGVNLILAPVVDVNTEPKNPIINIRSFGDDELFVSKFGKSFAEGCHSEGVLTCAKHFPGHGSTKIDSHVTLPAIDKSVLLPFSELVKVVDSVMIGHLLAKDLDADLLATLSKKVITQCLRQQLKFDKLVITDALSMGAITEKFSEEEAMIMSLKAGADVLLCPNNPEEALMSLVNAVQAGRLNEKALDQSIERIFYAKEMLGLFSNKMVDVANVESLARLGKEDDLAQKMADSSITLVKDKQKLLPLKTNNVHYEFIGSKEDFVSKELLSSGIKLANSDSKIKEKDIFIAVISAKPSAGNKLELSGADVEKLNSIFSMTKNSIVISLGSPYVANELSNFSTYLCAYSDCEYSQKAVSKAILGVIKPIGKIPVSI